MQVLKIAETAVRTVVVVEGGAAVGNRLFQNFADAFQKRAAFLPGNFPAGRVWAELGTKQNFRSVNVADSGNHFPIQQSLFNRSSALAQLFKQIIRGQKRVKGSGPILQNKDVLPTGRLDKRSECRNGADREKSTTRPKS